MSQTGNLELRIDSHTKPMSATVGLNGHDVFRSIVELALLYDTLLSARKIPTSVDFENWFKEAVPRIFASSHVFFTEGTNADYEVIIDARRRIIMHNGSEPSYLAISQTMPYTIAGALDRLVNGFSYQVLNLEPLNDRMLKSDEADNYLEASRKHLSLFSPKQ